MKFLILLCIILAASMTNAHASTIENSCEEKLLTPSLYKKNNMTSYEMIVPGDDGWLFRSSTDFRADFSFDKRAIKSLKSLQDTLLKQGITLVIAYPPTRGIVAAENIPDDRHQEFNFNPETATKNYQSIFKPLQEKGIHIVGVEDFQKNDNFFRKRDQHWNAKGAKQTAKSITNYIKNLPVYNALKKETFKTTLENKYQFNGRFNDVTKKFCDLELPKENDSTFKTAPSDEKLDVDSLFKDKANPQVVLVGTSNSNAESFNVNFDGFLKEYLSADIANHAKPGAGFVDPFLTYLLSDDFRISPPKIIIWEIPSYYEIDKDADIIFNQLAAATYGACKGDDILHSTQMSFTQEGNKTVFDLDKNKWVNAFPNYLWLDFQDPFYKKFSMNITYSDDQKSTKGLRFERTKRFKRDGKFYTVFPKRKHKIQKIEIKVPSKLVGNSLTAKICKPPR